MRHWKSLVALGVLAGCSAAPVGFDHPVPTSSATTPPTPTVAPTAAPTTGPIEAPSPDIGDTSAPTSFPAFTAAPDATVAKLVKSQNRVAMDLYRRVANGDDNLVMSPTSISLAFGMVYAGAHDNTSAQMAKAFRYNLPHEELHAAFGTVLRRWNSKDKRPYELAVANRLFGEKSMEFKQGFLSVTGDHYQAELEELDFRKAPDAARIHINDWVDEQTHSLIQDLLPKESVKDFTSLVLTNAIYFKGKWKQAFDEKVTLQRDFVAPSGKVTAKMMNLTGHHHFAHVDGVKMLQMAYQGDDFAMQLVLPDAVDGLADLEAKLESGELDKLAGKLQSHQVIVSLPRFKVAPSKPMALSKTLRAMGMTDAWSRDKAQLRRMAKLKPNEYLFIQEAFHKAFIEVEEEGTEAAAATAVVIGIGRTSVQAPPPPPKRFNADHPFLFVIRDVKTNAIVFIGRVNDPTKRS